MEELSASVNEAMHSMQIDLKSGFYLIRIALGHARFTAVCTEFGLYEYLINLFGLCKAPANFAGEINKILRPLLELQLVMKADVHIDGDNNMVVGAYIDDIFLAATGSPDKYYMQISMVFQLLMNNHMCIETDKCLFNVSDTVILWFMVRGAGLQMDPDKAKAIIAWPRPTSTK